MTDRELLELAAKAAGIKQHPDHGCEHLFLINGAYITWNPLANDGDALRLAVKLNLSMDLFDNEILVGYTPNCNTCDQVIEPAGNDPYAATRQAIVRAAAEIGKEMK